MKKLVVVLNLLVSCLWLFTSCADQTEGKTKLSVEERMAKARDAKSQRKQDRAEGKRSESATPSLKAGPADYSAPVDKVLKGPHGEVVHTGERGAKFYINKNGNKTYLSSNQ